MLRQPPPPHHDGALAYWPLPSGMTLSRVHHDRYTSCAFNPVPTDLLFGGGRFDATERDPHGFLYAALDDGAAVAEALLRDVKSDHRGWRGLPRPMWSDRELSRLTTTTPLTLIALRTGTDLGTIGQDSWLTTCDPDHYPQTREWARWLRSTDKNAHGAAWFSKRDPGATVLVLWEDRCLPGTLIPALSPTGGRCHFDEPAGFHWLREVLRPYRVTVS